jgi:hypothetical protein
VVVHHGRGQHDHGLHLGRPAPTEAARPDEPASVAPAAPPVEPPAPSVAPPAPSVAPPAGKGDGTSNGGGSGHQDDQPAENGHDNQGHGSDH